MWSRVEMALQGPVTRGPRLGDSASLWNIAPSPGWTQAEIAVLRLCLLKHGVGRWMQIIDSGLLSGKLIQQLSGQTQRLVGQQSLAAYTNLQVDVDRIRDDNERRVDARRKNGLIIWTGPNPTRAMRARWQQEAHCRYGLSEEQKATVETQYTELIQTAQGSQKRSTRDLCEIDLAGMDRQEKLALLAQLRARLQQLLSTQSGAQGDEPPGACERVSAATLPQQGCDSMFNNGISAGMIGTENMPRMTALFSRQRTVIASKRPRAALRPLGPRRDGPARAARRKRLASSHCDLADEAEGATDEEDAEAAVSVLEADIGQLEAMGFGKAKAREALQASHHSLDGAIEWLMANTI